jgi:hypothetical protein
MKKNTKSERVPLVSVETHHGVCVWYDVVVGGVMSVQTFSCGDWCRASAYAARLRAAIHKAMQQRRAKADCLGSYGSMAKRCGHQIGGAK